MKIVRIFALICFLLITNKWFSYEQGIRILKAEDTIDYMAIALAAPGLPSDPIPFHHAQRFSVPFLVGLLSNFFGISREKMFLCITLVCCALMIIVASLILKELKLNPAASFLCLSLLILNPYVFRYYLAVPAMINDPVFVLGLTIGLLGLFRRNFLVVVAGLILAAIARQTAIILLPGFILWFYLGSGWREREGPKKFLFSFISCIVVFSVYKLTSFVASSFSGQNFMRFDLLGLYLWFKRTPNLAGMVEFLGRGIISYVFPLLLLIAVEPYLKGRDRPWEFFICIVITLSLLCQPFVAGPTLVGKNMTRLSALGFVPLLIAFALRLKDLRFDFQASHYFLLTGLIMLGSFHHMTSIVGGDMTLAPWFSLIYVSLAVATSLLFSFMMKKEFFQKP